MRRFLIKRILLSYLIIASILFVFLELLKIDIVMGKVQVRLLLAAFIALLVPIFICLLQMKKITKFIKGITEFSRDITSGNLDRSLYIEENAEIGELTNTINSMVLSLRERLKQSEEEKGMLEAMLKNLSDGLILVDVKGRIMLCNEAVRSLCANVLDIERKTLAETLRNAELLDVVMRVIETEEPFTREVVVFHPIERNLLVKAMPFYFRDGGGKISGVLLTLHDITQLKRLEEMRKDFVANVSHEIKTPITAIKGFAETLLDGAIDDRENALKFLETIKSHSERLNSLVTDLLTLSKIELGDIRIEKDRIDLDEVVDTVFTILREKASAKGLFLRKSFARKHPEIYADKNRLVQILLNLVDNGIKFTEQGEVTVGLEEAEGQKELFVKDTGIGIPRQHIPRLGERFYRVDRARSRELGGTGLGLAIVKHLVKAHGWRMEIESMPQRGTRVKIFLKG